MIIDPKYKIHLAAAKSDVSRPTLESVYVHRRATTGEPVAAATDGRILAIVPVEPSLVPETGDELPEIPAVGEPGILVPPDAIKHAGKKGNLGRLAVQTVNTPGHVSTIDGHGWALPAVDPERPFPEYENVVPQTDRPVKFRVSFDARLLSKLADAIGADKGAVTLEFGVGEFDAIRVLPIDKDGKRVADGEGVLMPMIVKE